MKYGVVDIGSNSVRLMISDGENTVKKEIEITALAENMGEERELKEEPVKRTLLALSFFVKRAREEKVDKIYAFATACVRTAKNGLEFVERVKRECGVDVEIVSGESEARLGALGALSGKDGGIIDIGGASTEIAVYKNGNAVFVKSFPVGAVNLTDKFKEDKEKITEYLKSVFSDSSFPFETSFSCIGGTATSLVSMTLKLNPYDPEKVDGYVLYKTELKRAYDELFSLTVKERENLVGLQKKRARVIQSGCAILYNLFGRLNLDFVKISEKDNLEGYLLYKTRGL